MGAAIGLREDFESGQLRALAKLVKDACQARRLLALAVIYDGGRRTAARPGTSLSNGRGRSSQSVCAIGRMGSDQRKLVSARFLDAQTVSIWKSAFGLVSSGCWWSKWGMSVKGNHAYSISLHFMYYNFCRIHKALRVTPAMEAGVTDRLWDIEDIVKVIDDAETAPRKRGPYKKRGEETSN